jgi:serine/threonine protein kinase
MHNLSSCFIEEYEERGKKIIEDNIYYSFSIIFKSNSKHRKFYVSDINTYNCFTSCIKQAIGYRKFEDYYEIKEEIGVGRNSHVNLGIQKDTGKLVTIKIIKKSDETIEEEELVRYEIDILKFCHHKNIAHLVDYFETIDKIIIILNYIKGNTFSEYLKENNFNLKEAKAANIIIQIANGIKYLHKFGIVHRDLKPDNIMIMQNDNQIIAKIMDFGLSKIVSKEETLNEGFGTLFYAAPEIIQNMPYNKEVDVWSLGVILFYMFTGCYPFMGKEEEEIEEKIINDPVEFKDGEWEILSDKLKDLIQKCLEKYPEERITIDDFINHPWFKLLLK